MTRLPLFLLLAASAAPSLAVAQAMVQPLPGTTDADRLAAQMRLLASNPTDVSALLAAGELSVKLDDLGAAASFFARADKVDPRNGRAKAGEASILVHAERPGEALRYFALAESYGLPAAGFAADRGLAYDLIGEGERAQRDYRLALRTAPNEETQRRYALSLAITGKRDLADQQLQPLLHKSDRAAWRARAFILAMGGNVGEASRIATTMMPPGTAAGLQPFLERLPTLGPVDRAFAVHFGEVRSSPQRLADARLVPALPALGPDPYAPRAVLAAATTAPAPAEKGKRRKGKDKEVRQPVQVAVATPAPQPLPQTPAYRAAPMPATATAPVLATRGTAPTAWPTSVPLGQPVTRAPVTLAASPMTSVSTPAGRSAAIPVAPRPAAVASAPTSSPAVATTSLAAASPAPVAVTPAAGAPPAETNVVVAAAPVVTLPPAPAAAALVQPSVAATPSVRTVQALPTPAPVVVSTTPRRAASVDYPTTVPIPPRHRNDGVLSRIVAGLPIPASELGVAGPVRASAPPVAEPVPAAPSPDPAAERAAGAKALADKKAADRKAAAEKKALAEKKAAAAQKAEEAREAAAQKKLERANPERIWVQVAGGAYEGDLPKAWAAAKKKGGDIFAGHTSGYTTPLRFTNRVLAGPFKTDEEARSFVNKLKAKGLSGFTFTSDAGQVVKKLESE